MNLLFYFGHPAQYHFLKYTASELRLNGHRTYFLIKSKDVLEDLLKENQEEYINILPEGRKDSRLQILTGLIKRDFRLFRFVLHKKIDILIGTDPSLAHVGWLLRIPVLTVLEDDIDVIPALAKLTFPFTTHIVTPSNVEVGKFLRKKIGYNGYMKLAYLHPRFLSDKFSPISQRFFLIRLSGLNAYHDQHIKGMNELLLDEIVKKLLKHGLVYISSEKALPEKYLGHSLRIIPTEIHNYLANASLFISDSQSMSMEAAMLGTPSIRFSDFANRISVLDELEKKYYLTFGIKTSEPIKLIEKIDELISMPDLKEIFQQRRQRMLSEKIDVTAFMVWLIENYPESARIMQDNPDYQERFRQTDILV